MITSFGNQLTEDLFHGRDSKHTRKFPSELKATARRKLFTVHYANEPADLRFPPGNRLEKKEGDLKDYWAIRINDQWRIIFKWNGQFAEDVAIVDYH